MRRSVMPAVAALVIGLCPAVVSAGSAGQEDPPTAVVGHTVEVHGEGEGHGSEQAGHDMSQIKWLPSTSKEDAREYPAFFWMVLNFLVLAALLYFAGRKSVASFLGNRRNRIMASMDEASRIKKEAEERHAEYSRRLSRIKEEERSIRDELLGAAIRDKERLVADAGARAEKLRAEARIIAEREGEEARLVLRRETADKAVRVAHEILEKRLGPGEHRRLVEDYLQLMEKQVKS